eukprot:6238012-Prymnesium_polylepis.2
MIRAVACLSALCPLQPLSLWVRSLLRQVCGEAAWAAGGVWREPHCDVTRRKRGAVRGRARGLRPARARLEPRAALRRQSGRRGR